MPGGLWARDQARFQDLPAPGLERRYILLTSSQTHPSTPCLRDIRVGIFGLESGCGHVNPPERRLVVGDPGVSLVIQAPQHTTPLK